MEFAIDFGTVTVTESAAYAVFSASAGLVSVSPNILLIMDYQMLRNGMINAILREDFGIESDLYDYQDFLLGL